MNRVVETRQQRESKDLGLGSRLAQESRERFLNQDGSFNVARRGLSFYRALNVYHALLTMSWVRFQLLIVLAYLVTNVVFAAGYLACGPGALENTRGGTTSERFLEAFFFSVQTLATIGYGHISPAGFAANVLVTTEALVGLMVFALATGILFARFSRPIARIVFSRVAVIAPYHGITAFQFRIVNERNNQLINVSPTVVFSRTETRHGKRSRQFYALDLERKQVTFLPLHWVIVHPIEESSPLYGISEEALQASDAEFLILLTAVDETFSDTVHARSSYKGDEIVWGAKFSDIFLDPDGAKVAIDLRRFHDVEPAPLPAFPPSAGLKIND